MRKTSLLIVITLLTIDSYASTKGSALGSSYTASDFKDDWSSPSRNQKSRNILYWGALITSALILSSQDSVIPIQDHFSKEKPLGQYSKYGDLLGQMLPNLFYIAYQGGYSENKNSRRRATLMLKASLFSGATSFFAKRLVNQRRPNKGDRLSFPSGHTTTAFAFSSVIALEHPEWSIPAYLLASFVGLSRMNDNAHYIHDVAMGASIGMAYGYALYKESKKGDQKEASTFSFQPLHNGGVLSYHF